MSSVTGPIVGVAVLIAHGDKMLLMKRLKDFGQGTWAPPGGHLEAGESFEDCAKREVLEETGIHIDNVQVCGVTNDIFEDTGKHYVTVFVETDVDSDFFEMREPTKYGEYTWCDIEELPENLFQPFQTFLDSMMEEGA